MIARIFSRKLAATLALGAFATISADASDIIPAPPQAKAIAIKGATIHPVSGPDIALGTIVFENGKITAIGTEVALPEGAEVIDATGKHVYPGLINAHTVLGLVEIGAVRATIDVAESGAINPNVRSITSVNPDSELIPVARSNGILTALSVPEGGIISGQSAVFRLDGWTPEEMTVRSPTAMHLRWPNLTIDRKPRAKKSVKDQQKEIDKAQKQIRDAFQIARSYWQARKNPSPDFKSDLRWEAMMPLFEGKLPLFVHAGTLAQIEAALAWAREAQLKVVLGPTTSLPPRRDDGYDSGWSNAAKLHEAGVRFCIASDGRGAETNERNVGYEAGMAAAFGLPKEEALKAVTLYPAQILGVSDRLGSLETGKSATLIVTNGDPLDLPTQVEAAYIDGRKIDLSNRQTQLRDKYREKYRRK
jgi:imidazolonepropionase-like amidohydrolase